MRGRLFNIAETHVLPGNTPAYAGKTEFLPGFGGGCGKHPRVCGEDLQSACNALPGAETPPRMRGRPDPLACKYPGGGNTPAYAGKTLQCASGGVYDEKHPRVCGEDCITFYGCFTSGETPPRMRGRPMKAAGLTDAQRNTPAYAGKTLRLTI